MTNPITLLFILYALIACKSQEKVENYEFDNDGLIIEKFDSTYKTTEANPNNSIYLNFDDNRFNQNNKIYKVGRKFVFKYYYLDKSGNKFLFSREKISNENNYDWKFEHEEKLESNSCVWISMTINSGLKPFINQFPDYSQTVFTNEYLLRN